MTRRKEKVDTLVIGAGQAGLATSYWLFAGVDADAAHVVKHIARHRTTPTQIRVRLP